MDFFNSFFDKVPLIGMFVSFAAYFLGIKFPDWDFKIKLAHRNILTHSPLILIIFVRLYEESKNDMFRFFLIGFSLALALHFIFDMYPRGWGGGALIHIPFKKRACNVRFSKMILIFSAVVSAVIAVAYTHNITEFYYIGVIGLITILKDTVKEEKLFRPLFSFAFFIFVLGCIKYRELFLGLKAGSHYLYNQISMFF